MYKYETHLHTSPVSRCASASALDTLKFYKSKGFDGVFITNHFLDGNINIDWNVNYEKKIEFYFSDYEEALRLSGEVGIKVFLGIEMSYSGTGTDFLVYGLDKDWFLAHPEVMDMKKSAQLNFLRENGAFVIQAHPFREASYIDHINLFPRNIDGVEVINACRTELENKLAYVYADSYGLYRTAGSDNHCAERAGSLAWVETEQELNSVWDYIDAVKNHKIKLSFERL